MIIPTIGFIITMEQLYTGTKFYVFGNITDALFLLFTHRV